MEACIKHTHLREWLYCMTDASKSVWSVVNQRRRYVTITKWEAWCWFSNRRRNSFIFNMVHYLWRGSIPELWTFSKHTQGLMSHLISSRTEVKHGDELGRLCFCVPPLLLKPSVDLNTSEDQQPETTADTSSALSPHTFRYRWQVTVRLHSISVSMRHWSD